jgi:hypothetical protein
MQAEEPGALIAVGQQNVVTEQSQPVAPDVKVVQPTATLVACSAPKSKLIDVLVIVQ